MLDCRLPPGFKVADELATEAAVPPPRDDPAPGAFRLRGLFSDVADLDLANRRLAATRDSCIPGRGPKLMLGSCPFVHSG